MSKNYDTFYFCNSFILDVLPAIHSPSTEFSKWRHAEEEVLAKINNSLMIPIMNTKLYGNLLYNIQLLKRYK